jgi:uncharacterized membrane protein
MDEYSVKAHWTLTIIGLLLLIILVFTLRSEISFLRQYRRHKAQMILSLISMAIMIFLTLVLLFHWSLSPFYAFTAIMFLTPLLLILAPLILWLRARAFRSLTKSRIEEKKRLIREVQEMLDEQKRQKIREGKIARGEPVDE